MIKTLAVVALLAALSGALMQAQAQTVPAQPSTGDIANPDVQALLATLDLPQVIAVMHEEGIAYGEKLEDDLFPGAGGTKWAAKVATIYDADAMNRAFSAGFAAALPPGGRAAMLAFFGSELGQRVIELELSARLALLDEAVEDVANQTRDAMRAGDGNGSGARLDLLTGFVEANDLIESNVSGAMNSNYAFYRGLVDGGAFPQDVPEAEIMADVWSQEAQIRTDTTDWLYAYLGMAYQPLSDAELQAYIDFSRTPEGRGLNQALFTAFDGMFVDISHDLGAAAAQFMIGEDI